MVADISEPHERGTFFGFMGIGPMVGPCLGPGKVAMSMPYAARPNLLVSSVLGGALSQGLGWRYARLSD